VTPGATEYLVQYGRPAFVGRFGSAAELACGRGDPVVIRSPRGLEVGTVLCPATNRFARLIGPAADGELIRPATPEDLSLIEQLAERGGAVLAAADRLAAAAQAPVTFLDAEVLLDGTAAVLHAVAFGDTDLTPLLDTLSRECGLVVRLHDTARTPVAKDAPEAAGCGKPDCGSGSGGCSSCGTGGCSSGGCSRGSVKSADDLTVYFADLRQKMDAHFGGPRTPLN
jgi:hypothetical protein